jgi:16S rRNA G527 N7-methylase RsmG
VELIEPRRKRAAFLEYVVAELSLPNVGVQASRAQDADVSADAACARAVADASTSWLLAEPLLNDDGCLVYFAGSSWAGPDEAGLEAIGAVGAICDGPQPGGGGPLVLIRRSVRDPPVPLDISET